MNHEIGKREGVFWTGTLAVTALTIINSNVTDLGYDRITVWVLAWRTPNSSTFQWTLNHFLHSPPNRFEFWPNITNTCNKQLTNHFHSKAYVMTFDKEKSSEIHHVNTFKHLFFCYYQIRFRLHINTNHLKIGTLDLCRNWNLVGLHWYLKICSTMRFSSGAKSILTFGF